MLALMEQAGAFPFHYTGGANLGTDFTGSAAMSFANYWQALINAHDVNSTVDFSPTQASGWANEKDAVYIAAA